MQSAQIQLHASVEDSYWWFVGRRQIMRDLVREVLPGSEHATVVDVGCGTGAISRRWPGITIASASIRRPRRSSWPGPLPGARFLCGRAPPISVRSWRTPAWSC